MPSPKSIKKEIKEYHLSAYIDKFLNFLRKKPYANFVIDNENWLVKAGLWGLYLCGILGVVAAAVFVGREYFPAKVAFPVAGGYLLACIFLHYVAYAMLPTNRLLIENSPTKLSSSRFLDTMAVFIGVLGIAVLLGSIYAAIKMDAFSIFLKGLFVFILCEYWLAMLLQPKVINVEVAERTSIGEEFIGLISFSMKGMFRLIPVIFGSAIIVAVCLLVAALFTKFEYYGEISEVLQGIGYFTGFALLPLFGYLAFLFYYFTLDLIMAVLVLPEKLDKLAETKKK